MRFTGLFVAGSFRVLTGDVKRIIQSIAGICIVRNVSRHSRLMVFRVTARCANRLATTIPSRAFDNWFGRAYKTKCFVRAHGRIRKTDEKSSVLTIRRSEEKFLFTQPAKHCLVIQPNVYGLWHDVRLILHGRFWSPYGHGSRGCVCDAQLKVDKYVS